MLLEYSRIVWKVVLVLKQLSKVRFWISNLLDAFSRAPHGEINFVFWIQLRYINVDLSQMGPRNSFSFWAWIGLIWEISARKACQNAAFFGARLFCQNTKMSEFNDICNIKVFQDTVSEKGSCPNMPGLMLGLAQANIWIWSGPYMGLAHSGVVWGS